MSGAGRVVLGIDVGTSGVRTLAVHLDGEVAGEAGRAVTSPRPTPDGIHEQRPEDWWAAACATIGEALRAAGAGVDGIAVTSTSGSLVLTDEAGRPLRAALLYDDVRGEPGATGLNASFALAKALWVRKYEPAVWERVRHILHPADWLCGMLTGSFGVSDFSNCLKLGYDPSLNAWGSTVAASGLAWELLPRILCPGERIAAVSETAALATGLPAGTPVFAGATDGMASLIASGASGPGDASTTLGSTLVWKALAECRPQEKNGIYCHLHPSGLWAPGAASNSGPGSLTSDDPPLTAAQMEALAAPHFPVNIVCYLLAGQGERFPFVSREARTFVEGRPRQRGEWCAAQLQSLAFVERWGYEVLAEAGVSLPGTIYSSGGGAARSNLFSQLRADVLGRAVARTRHPGAAFGAAILAATGSSFGGDACGAIRAMTRLEQTFTPAGGRAGRLDEIYGLFRDACRRQGYGT